MQEAGSAGAVGKKLLRVLAGKHEAIPPVWLMRQAGRYLPEYRAVREKAGGFLDLCLNPELAAEVTLQPIRRFGFDAAILFSDILIVPLALGRKVEFLTGEGPKLEPLADAAGLAALRDNLDERVVGPVYETVRLVRGMLGSKTALIGFCGAPWTVATYMVAGEGTSDQAPARRFAYYDAENFQRLIDRPGESLNRISDRSVQGWRRGCAGLRYMGWCAPTRAIRSLVYLANAKNCRGSTKRDTGCKNHRVSTRCNRNGAALCRNDRSERNRCRLDIPPHDCA